MSPDAPQQRRHADRRFSNERRSGDGRRATDPAFSAWQNSSWQALRLQFLARYLFTLIGAILFNFVFTVPPEWSSLQQVNIFFAGYAVWITFSYYYTHRQHAAPYCIRINMWGDILGIAFVVINDPSTIPLTAQVWIVIVIGNGMRYGIRFFREALYGTFLVAALTLGGKSLFSPAHTATNIAILSFFSALVMVYAYLLMQRIDRSHQAVKQDSRLDPLTSLMNRGALTEAANALLLQNSDYNEPLVVMFVDLNRFKDINDTHGHAEGDRVLCVVAHMLRDNIRDSDIAARYGGDEFVILLRATDASNAGLVGQRIQKRITKWSRENGYDLSLSIGIGEAPAHGSDFAELLKKVDQAMYHSKFSNSAGGIAFVNQ